MVTDTIKKIANAILDAGEGCQSGLVYVDPVEAAKAAVAVLETDADPVAWQAQGDDGVWRYVEMPRTAKSTGMPVRQVYAAAPVPSVAVKALEWTKYPGMPDTHVWASSILGLYRISPVGREAFGVSLFLADSFPRYASMSEAKAAAQADYEARIRSALSSQAQDVAIPEGWKIVPIQITPDMQEIMIAGEGKPTTSTWAKLLRAASPAAKLEEKP